MSVHTRTAPNWTFYAMLAILLLASYIRIHDLNAQGLWGDEGWSIWLARGDSPRDLTMTMVADHHGPVYSILLRAWDALAGNTVVALRAITVLFSVASIALIYRLGRELFSPAAGVGAALAFTLMDKHVVLTQEVRDYPMIFFTMIGTATFYVRWRKNPHGGNAFSFVAFSVAGLYLHYYCYMVNVAILVHALITLRNASPLHLKDITGAYGHTPLPGRVASHILRWKREIKRPEGVPPLSSSVGEGGQGGEASSTRLPDRPWAHFLALNALIALAFLPWTFIVVHQFFNTPVDSEVLNIHGMPFNRHTLQYLATESFGKPIAIFALLALAGTLAPLIRTPGPMSTVPREKRLSGTLLAALWFGVPVFITTILHSRYPLLTDRNISVIMPAIALLVGHGLTAFERYGAVFLVVLVTIHGVFTTDAYFDKPPWREMAADIAGRYPGGDEIVLLDVEGAHAAMWYHTILALPDQDVDAIVARLPDEDTEPTVVSLYDYRKRYKGDFVPHLQAVLDGVPGLWLAYWGDEVKKHDTLDVLAAEGFIRTATREYEHHGNPIFAYRYDRLSALQNVVARYEQRLDPAESGESGDPGGGRFEAEFADAEPLIGDAITLHKAAWYALARRGDDLHVLLWWSADAPLQHDYNVSVFLLDGSGSPLFAPDGSLLAQHDGVPAEGTAPTTTWQPGAIVFDMHSLALPNNLQPGTYSVGVKLYTWEAGALVVLPTADGAEWQIVGSVVVE